MSYLEWLEKNMQKHKKIVDKLLAKNYTKKQIIEYFDFENMSKEESSFCPLYADDKKCHDMKKLNCYFCACPHFHFNDNGITKKDGKVQYSLCLINSKYTKEYVHKDEIHQDCSNCTIVHHKNYVERYFSLND